MRSENGKDETKSKRTPVRRILPIIIVFLAVHFLLIFFAESIPSQRVLFLFFFLSMVLLPGFLLTLILFPRAQGYFKIFLSLIFGSALIFIFLLVFSTFNLDIFYISILMPVLSVALSIYRDYGSFNGFELPNNQPLSRPVLILMIIIVVGVSIITLGVKDPIIYTGDSPDHIAYIRTITRTHEVFPNQFLYKDGGMLTRDIRRGLLHAMWGNINLLTARNAVYPIWSLISWIGSLFLLLGIFCLGIQFFKSQGIGILGVILYLLFYRGGLAGTQLITMAYGFDFGKIYFFAFLLFLPLFLRSFRKELLLLIALSSFAATGTHISYIMIIFFVTFIFITMEWFQSSKTSPKNLLIKISPVLFGTIFFINLPYLLIRYFRDYNPVNEIHTHVQGMLFITKNLAVLNPILFFQSCGYLMAISFFAVFILWGKSRKDKNLRLMLGTVAGVYILVFNPLWVPFVMGKITYLLVRFSVAAPTMIIVAYLLRTLWLNLRGKYKDLSHPMAIFGWIVIIAFLFPPLFSNINNFMYGGNRRKIREMRSVLNLSDLFSEIDRKIPEGSVIASDPVTSYCIPAFCDQYVICTYDQHSVPNDSTAFNRIIACRDIYLPSVPCNEINQTLKKYEAEYLIINGRIPAWVSSQYWRPDNKVAKAAAQKLLRCKNDFHLIYSRESIWLFKYVGSKEVISEGAPSTLDTISRQTVRKFNEDYKQLTESGIEGIYVKDCGTESRSVERGDTLRLYVDWVLDRKKKAGSYTTYIRFDTDFQKGPLYSRHYSKIYRKVIEKVGGKRFRFRCDKLPFEGIYPPDKWNPGQIVKEYMEITIPRDIAKGIYTISIKMDHRPHVPNYWVKDFLTDNDVFDGPDLMKITIE